MPSTDQIVLHNLIDHQVDHLHAAEARVSEGESPISDEVADFLKNHIVLNREHNLARSATFLDGAEANAGMKAICDDLLKPRGRFVPQSQKIAHDLFASMKSDKRIHPGDLIVCTFSVNGGDKWLALLKLDPQDSFISEEQQIDGKRCRVLKKVPQVLPSGELQKCAFVLPPSLRDRQRDLIVLDLQTARYGAWRQVASFFSRDFLQCKVGLNDYEMTKAFNDFSHTFAESKRGIWPDKKIEKFQDEFRARLADTFVPVVHFARAAIEKVEDQDQYLDTFAKRVNAASHADLDFVPDPAVIKMAEMLQIDGDDGLRIRIKKSAVGNTLTYRRDKAQNVYVITIKTHNLKGLPEL